MTKRIFKYDVREFSARFVFSCGDSFVADFKGRDLALVDSNFASLKDVYIRTAEDAFKHRLASYKKTGFIMRDDILYPMSALLKIEIFNREILMKSLLVEEFDGLPEDVKFEDLEVAEEDK